ncbi:MAG: DUF1624 domain-containing protein [Rhizobiaceae bacterium]|nr:DUF1624 domain-containing protein [Rhizobiaceae bacterium]
MSGQGAPPSEGRGNRLDLLDAARGAALLAMVVYHFTWDLEFFGYVERGTTGSGGWKLFARSIASSFLFLAGVSLVLAHGRAIRWRAFGGRFLQVVAGAAIITGTTYFATPGGFVFFGILHEIALASFLGLAFVRLRFWLTALAGFAVIALAQVFETPLTNPKWLAWIGMAERPPVSNDYVPLFPWFGAVLLGIAAARLVSDRGGWEAIGRAGRRLTRLSPLSWLGRRSLVFYLLHQPILFGLVWAFAQVSPPDPATILQSECRRGCISEGREADFCAAYCGCIGVKLENADLLRAFLEGLTTREEDAEIEGMVLECSMPR